MTEDQRPDAVSPERNPAGKGLRAGDPIRIDTEWVYVQKQLNEAVVIAAMAVVEAWQSESPSEQVEGELIEAVEALRTGAAWRRAQGATFADVLDHFGLSDDDVAGLLFGDKGGQHE